MVSTSTGCLLNLGCGSLGRQRKVLDESSRETNSIKKILNFFKKLRRLGRQGKKRFIIPLHSLFLEAIGLSQPTVITHRHGNLNMHIKIRRPGEFSRKIFFFVHYISLGPIYCIQSMRHHLAVQCVNIALIQIQRQLWKIQVKTTLTPEFNEKFACITWLLTQR